MSIIKPSDVFKGADWSSGDVRAYMKDQSVFPIDTVQDVRDNDFEQTRFLYVKAKGAFYRLNLSSTAADNGDLVLRDNVGRRYEKQAGVAGVGREILTANRTYYVRTDGSDSNNGLVNSAGGAFLTVQNALNVAAMLDLAGFKVTVSVGAGTFSGRVIVPLMVGQTDVSKLEIIGAGVTTILTAAGSFVNSTVYCGVPGAGATISNVKIQNTNGGGNGCTVNVENSGQITLGAGVELGQSGWVTARAATNGVLKFTAGATFSGNAANIFGAQFGGYVEITGTFALGTRTVTATVTSESTGAVFANSASFTGTVTGTRYTASVNGIIYTGGGGATYFPGSIAGTTATGGQYV